MSSSLLILFIFVILLIVLAYYFTKIDPAEIVDIRRLKHIIENPISISDANLYNSTYKYYIISYVKFYKKYPEKLILEYSKTSGSNWWTFEIGYPVTLALCMYYNDFKYNETFYNELTRIINKYPKPDRRGGKASGIKETYTNKYHKYLYFIIYNKFIKKNKLSPTLSFDFANTILDIKTDLNVKDVATNDPYSTTRKDGFFTEPDIGFIFHTDIPNGNGYLCEMMEPLYYMVKTDKTILTENYKYLLRRIHDRLKFSYYILRDGSLSFQTIGGGRGIFRRRYESLIVRSILFCGELLNSKLPLGLKSLEFSNQYTQYSDNVLLQHLKNEKPTLQIGKSVGEGFVCIKNQNVAWEFSVTTPFETGTFITAEDNENVKNTVTGFYSCNGNYNRMFRGAPYKIQEYNNIGVTFIPAGTYYNPKTDTIHGFHTLAFLELEPGFYFIGLSANDVSVISTGFLDITRNIYRFSVTSNIDINFCAMSRYSENQILSGAPSNKYCRFIDKCDVIDVVSDAVMIHNSTYVPTGHNASLHFGLFPGETYTTSIIVNSEPEYDVSKFLKYKIIDIPSSLVQSNISNDKTIKPPYLIYTEDNPNTAIIMIKAYRKWSDTPSKIWIDGILPETSLIFDLFAIYCKVNIDVNALLQKIQDANADDGGDDGGDDDGGDTGDDADDGGDDADNNDTTIF